MNWYKVTQQESKGVISFDFDSTLTTPQWSYLDGMWVASKNPNMEYIDLLRKFASQGYDIIIVTSRHAEDEDKADISVNDFVQQHNLPVSKVIFTGQDPKGPYLSEQNALKHFDDHMPDVDSANEYGVEGVKVFHPDDEDVD